MLALGADIAQGEHPLERTEGALDDLGLDCRGANVHLAIGKKSFGEKALLENYATVVEEIVRAKPSASKGRYINKITLTSTMGPGIHVDTTRTRNVAAELEEELATA